MAEATIAAEMGSDEDCGSSVSMIAETSGSFDSNYSFESIWSTSSLELLNRLRRDGSSSLLDSDDDSKDDSDNDFGAVRLQPELDSDDDPDPTFCSMMEEMEAKLSDEDW